MSIQVPVLGVLLAAASAMVVGMVWYHPSVFGKSWMQMIGLKESEMKKNMSSAMASLVVVSLVTAYVLVHFINYTHYFTGGTWMSASLMTAFWAWVGFCLTTTIAHGAFEPRDKKVMLINSGNRLVTLWVMALILGVFLK